MSEITFQWFDQIAGGFLGQNRPQAFSEDSCFILKQVHGDGVVVLRQATDIVLRNSPGDAILCSLPNINIAVQTADCVPILWAHPAGIVAAVHAGWKGSRLGILQKSLETLKTLWGHDTKEVRLAIGPAISGEVYEVGPEVAEVFQKLYPLCLNPLGEKFLLDLTVFNRYQALEMGVPEASIRLYSHCTYLNSGFFSHRRAQKAGLTKTGRNFSYICRKQ